MIEETKKSKKPGKELTKIKKLIYGILKTYFTNVQTFALIKFLIPDILKENSSIEELVEILPIAAHILSLNYATPSIDQVRFLKNVAFPKDEEKLEENFEEETEYDEENKNEKATEEEYVETEENYPEYFEEEELKEEYSKEVEDKVINSLLYC